MLLPGHPYDYYGRCIWCPQDILLEPVDKKALLGGIRMTLKDTGGKS
jgi:hypothetical protein